MHDTGTRVTAISSRDLPPCRSLSQRAVRRTWAVHLLGGSCWTPRGMSTESTHPQQRLSRHNRADGAEQPADARPDQPSKVEHARQTRDGARPLPSHTLPAPRPTASACKPRGNRHPCRAGRRSAPPRHAHPRATQRGVSGIVIAQQLPFSGGTRRTAQAWGAQQPSSAASVRLTRRAARWLTTLTSACATRSSGPCQRLNTTSPGQALHRTPDREKAADGVAPHRRCHAGWRRRRPPRLSRVLTATIDGLHRISAIIIHQRGEGRRTGAARDLRAAGRWRCRSASGCGPGGRDQHRDAAPPGPARLGAAARRSRRVPMEQALRRAGWPGTLDEGRHRGAADRRRLGIDSGHSGRYRASSTPRQHQALFSRWASSRSSVQEGRVPFSCQ